MRVAKRPMVEKGRKKKKKTTNLPKRRRNSIAVSLPRFPTNSPHPNSSPHSETARLPAGPVDVTLVPAASAGVALSVSVRVPGDHLIEASL
mmetsp:Transcript_40774/g.80345  ORF Transcript_40774/g.80345 Transcript_40774/m.80345 type:complete len:91 (+) Transcript_40774:375-647(+)